MPRSTSAAIICIVILISIPSASVAGFPVQWDRTYAAAVFVEETVHVAPDGSIIVFGEDDGRAVRIVVDPEGNLIHYDFHFENAVESSGGLDSSGTSYLIKAPMGSDPVMIRLHDDGTRAWTRHISGPGNWPPVFPIRQLSTGHLMSVGHGIDSWGGIDWSWTYFYYCSDDGATSTVVEVYEGMAGDDGYFVPVAYDLDDTDQAYLLIQDAPLEDIVLKLNALTGNTLWSAPVFDDLGVMYDVCAWTAQGGCVVSARDSYTDPLLVHFNSAGDDSTTRYTDGLHVRGMCESQLGNMVLFGIQDDHSAVLALLDQSMNLLHRRTMYEYSPQYASVDIAATPDDGFVLLCSLSELRLIKVGGTVPRLIGSADDPVPSEGGEYPFDLTVYTGEVRDHDADLLVRADYAEGGYEQTLLEQELALTAHDTSAFPDRVLTLTGDMPDGMYRIISEISSQDGRYTVRDTIEVAKGAHGVSESVASARLPELFRLHPVQPNPFNSKTTIRFDLGHPANVNLTVFDLLGREVTVLSDGQPYAPGTHRVVWDASGLPGGTYFLRARTEDEQQVRRMLFLK